MDISTKGMTASAEDNKYLQSFSFGGVAALSENEEVNQLSGSSLNGFSEISECSPWKSVCSPSQQVSLSGADRCDSDQHHKGLPFYNQQDMHRRSDASCLSESTDSSKLSHDGLTETKKKIFLNLKSNRYDRAETYHKIIISACHIFEKHLDFREKGHSLSQGEYDYRRVQFDPIRGSRENSLSSLLEVDVNQLILLDSSLLSPGNISPHSNHLKLFVSNLFEKMNEEVRSDFFLKFVNLSLSFFPSGEQFTYGTWKKSLFDKIRDLSEPVKGSILEGIKSRGVFSVERASRSINRIVLALSKMMASQIMSHSLISIPIISDDEVIKRIIVSRPGLAFFLNKYANVFLKKFVSVDFMLYPKKCYNIYAWMRRAKKIIETIKSDVHGTLENFIESDRCAMAEKLFIFDGNNFRKMTGSEFDELLGFVKDLAFSQKDGAILDRVVRHFYKNILK